ncbi:MAG: FAD-dependent oxidoreductase [bacterium]|nr:FAD-dependent oxidoreductase [bacterium]
MKPGKYKVEIADNAYWRRQIECQRGCPVGTDARGYVIAIAEGRYLDAYKFARGPNPFASICGRVCAAPCEVECRRGSIDEPISIRALKRFVTEQYGVEKVIPPEHSMKYSTARRDPNNPKAGTKVAVIGAGPAGLAAAHDLGLLGYQVTIFEASRVAGGMLYLGIPEFRLPRNLIQAEIDAILNSGVELRTNTPVGEDLTLDDLEQQGFKAIFISIGTQQGRQMDIPGEDEFEGVIDCIQFLRALNLGHAIQIGKKAIVIGAGDSAMDAARVAIRLTSDNAIVSDSARSALRLGVGEVDVLYRRSRVEMPANPIEVDEAENEGVQFHFLTAPLRVLGENGKVTGLECIRMRLGEPDDSGRRRPIRIDGSEYVVKGDLIIPAIGQAIDPAFLKAMPGVEVSSWGTIEIDPNTLATSRKGVFAGGDVAFGPKTIIHAIANGQTAARSIDEYLRGEELSLKESGSMQVIEAHKMVEGYLVDRRDLPTAPVEDRGMALEVENVFPEDAAVIEGARCLKCHINTIFNGDLCIMCNRCVDVCPLYCLKLVHLSDLEIDNRLEATINYRYGTTLQDLSESERFEFLRHGGSAMLKDEEKCIRCAFCEIICPTGAITMEQFSFTEEAHYE